ncbi:MAG: DUF3459 domain-containing protein [Cyanothece sp. SIO1E1]|nr:DUF3459 domain-containing protein [Cyanothece sp. SIO1E1]
MGQNLTHDWRNEIIYHVMPRSFHDSNGDRHGDLNGFVQKLDYLQELGVTTILFTPLYESGFYHNYFPTDYEKIDPEYGTMEDYINFVKEVHKRGMKFLMDMETQYAMSGHRWFDESYKNPDSEYSDFIYYSDENNEFPEQIFRPANSPLFEFTAWPGDKHNIVLLDLNNERVKKWMTDFYLFWVDPNKDGNFDDGVDGFRIDHIMDDLDYKGIMTNLYADFWKPIFEACKRTNPEVFILGEQSNWTHYGENMVKQSGADAAFSFPLRFALAGVEGIQDMYTTPGPDGVVMDPERIHYEIRQILDRFGGNTFSINFLENHDTHRWASVVNGNKGQMKIGAVLNLLLPGVPSIYYGQELGMPGKTYEWGSDANHIPVREAFPWSDDVEQTGIAAFYKDGGEPWEVSIYVDGRVESLALPVQKAGPNSLYNHYRELISIRNSEPALRLGGYRSLDLYDAHVIGFTRFDDHNELTVLANLSGTEQQVNIDALKIGDIYPRDTQVEFEDGILTLDPYQYLIIKN